MSKLKFILNKNLIYLSLFSLILILSIFLRFWHLDTISGPVFDEVYFPLYGYDYLVGKTFFHVHPPLANYIFASSIWLYYHFPWVSTTDFHTIPYEQIPAMSYRWINAFMGVILTLVAWLTAYIISQKKWFALIVFFLISIDGSLLVDSRHGMNNIYIVLFGLCSILFLSKALQAKNRHIWLILCGIFIGLTISVKWNGSGYLLAILMFLTLYKVLFLCDKYRPVLQQSSTHNSVLKFNVAIWEMLVYLLVLPFIVYCLVWIPDRLFNTEYSFVGIHQQIMMYHQNLVTADEHPYCSKWYTWPFMIRPIGYSFSTETIYNALGQKSIIYTDVHLFPNPAIAWFSAIAIICMVIHWLVLFRNWFLNGVITRAFMVMSLLLAGYFANFLPWVLVKRCLFLYHYQSAATFGIFILAWYIAYLSSAKAKGLKLIAIFIFVCILASFIYWLPIQLGIPLEQSQFNQRMWLSSWI
ncbi:phospholipid carrier-dependent glycosyltransferase [Francisella frigiditurris]|uniref:Polyprenol-phosphate-mannose--protein mannosyltransferase n=1 Tax=Francisella frigiditurris TaxID=1542390 RepID=A0A1J0KVB5_9GAMM|nr:phospholipid carrier-dependent glycosyltransferase [Francisella frigiditurris]APC97618.1 dolichyl-phosphate-mannose-mannosyltransferase family protein [Francisella frigiditurris]